MLLGLVLMLASCQPPHTTFFHFYNQSGKTLTITDCSNINFIVLDKQHIQTDARGIAKGEKRFSGECLRKREIRVRSNQGDDWYYDLSNPDFYWNNYEPYNASPIVVYSEDGNNTDLEGDTDLPLQIKGDGMITLGKWRRKNGEPPKPPVFTDDPQPNGFPVLPQLMEIRQSPASQGV